MAMAVTMVTASVLAPQTYENNPTLFPQASSETHLSVHAALATAASAAALAAAAAASAAALASSMAASSSAFL